MGPRISVRASGALLALVAVSWIPPVARAVNPLAPPECGVSGEGVPPARTRFLRVATYNVLHGLDESPKTRYPAHSTLDPRLRIAARELAADGVDVVGMQEVSKTTDADHHHAGGLVAERLAVQLSRLTGVAWHWCWYRANPHFVGEPDVMTGGGGPLSENSAGGVPGPYDGEAEGTMGAEFREGVAILSRYAFLDSEGRRLPSRLPIEHAFCDPPDNLGCQLTIPFESRAALWANIATPGGATSIVTTHLSHDITSASDDSTLVQAAAVVAFEAEKAATAAEPPARRFLVCDCNSRDTADKPGDDVPVIPLIKGSGFIDTYRALTADAGYTGGPDTIVTPAATRTRRESFSERIDYVFWRPGTCQRLPVRSRIIADRPELQTSGRWAGMWLWPSDHLGVATDVPVGRCA